MSDEQVKPDYKIVAVDETEYWDLSEMPEVEKIYRLCAVDFNTHTYCCEMTPSLWLQPVDVTAHCKEGTSDPRLDQIDQIIREYEDYDGFYLHVYDAEKLKVVLECPELSKGVADGDVSRDDAIEYLAELAAKNQLI